MSDLNTLIQETLGRQLKQHDLDVVDVVPIPAAGDRMVRLRTLEEILDELDRSPEDKRMGYLIQVRPRPMPEPAADPVINPAKPALDGVYLPSGKMNAQFLLRNAELLLSAGDFVLARNIFKAVFQSGERPAHSLLGVAKTYEAEGKLTEARANFEESIAYQPTLEAYQRLASLLMGLNKHEQAAETLERALNLKDLSTDTRFELLKACGNSWMRSQNVFKAERSYKRALEINPSADEIQANLGALYLQNGKTKEAKRFFQDAISCNPRNDKALSGLGSCFLAEGDKRSAHDCFARSLNIELNNATAIFYLVKCAYEIKSYATAARILEEYVQIAPVNANLLYSLAGLQYHLGRIAEARATTTRILELQAQHAGALELMGLIERASGKMSSF